MTRRKGPDTGYSLIFKNHGQKLEEDLRHRVPEDPFYATVNGGIRRLEVDKTKQLSLKEIREDTAKQGGNREETRDYGVDKNDQATLKVLFENSGENEANFMINLNKFKQEVESVNSLLEAENDRLTEVRESMQSQVDTMKGRIESRKILSRNDCSG